MYEAKIVHMACTKATLCGRAALYEAKIVHMRGVYEGNLMRARCMVWDNIVRGEECTKATSCGRAALCEAKIVHMRVYKGKLMRARWLRCTRPR